MFRDIIGIIRPLKSVNIYLIFIKIAYSKIQSIINDFGGKLISNEFFVVALLEFYEILCFTSLDKMSRDSHTSFYRILNDTFKLLSTLSNLPTQLVAECNQGIKSLNYESLITFFKKKNKITSKFVSIAYNIMKNKSLNFSIFHYFGDKNFVFFLEQVFTFVFIFIPIAEVAAA